MPAIKFIPAPEFKEKFEVFGFFYDLEGRKNLRYRALLEIMRKDGAQQRKNILTTDPKLPKIDAVVVMMNPGSSRPLGEDSQNYYSNHAEASRNILKEKLVPTKPDPTQYQVERLMEYYKWNRVRVLNLSDIREPKSGKFYRWISEERNEHSFFSESRKKVLEKMIPEKVTVIAGWGMEEKLFPLITMAERFLKRRGNEIVGDQTGCSSFYFRHPSPPIIQRRLNWLNEVIGKMGE
ncbi:hypothetical protein BH09BAC5_BH09BAC5_22530 [soil metagenome]